MEQQQQPAWMTDVQVAAHFGIGRSSVWRWAKNGTLPAPVKIGGVVRWRRQDIEAVAATAA